MREPRLDSLVGSVAEFYDLFEGRHVDVIGTWVTVFQRAELDYFDAT
jgi:hypothetical protein